MKKASFYTILVFNEAQLGCENIALNELFIRIELKY